MKAMFRLLARALMVGLTWFVLAGVPATAQQGAASPQQQPYRGPEVQSTTYTWLAAAVMLAGTMVIAFRKPKRVASH